LSPARETPAAAGEHRLRPAAAGEDRPGPASAGATRRGLLAGALLAGALRLSEPARALAESPPHPPSDQDLLTGLLHTEALVAAVYTRVLDSGRLSPPVHRLARRVLAQEHVHAAALRTELKLLGGVPRAPQMAPVRVDAELARHRVTVALTDVSSEKAALRLLTQTESVAEGAYFAALSKLTEPRLLTLAAEILASEAQHFTLVAQFLHPHDAGYNQVVPDPFVQGRK
jgi:ferritin-like protein